MRGLQQLTRHLLSPSPSESDALLLAQLAGRQTDPALRVLMQRYGGLVLGVAQRVLRDAHLSEDAYQATFLLLVRKAGTVRHSLPAWLHRVALRLSLRMKSRLKPTVELPDTPATQQPHPVEQADVLGVIDEEIARLPTRLRAVVQWCYLNDATTAHAAEQLGIPRGTVLSRLDAARRKLQATLTRRGLTNLAILTVPILSATVSTALAERTTATILAYLSGATGPLVSLTTQEILSMTAQRWMKMLGIGVLTTGLGTGLLWLATPTAVQAQVQGVEKPKPPAEAKKPTDEKPEQKVKVEVVRKRLDTINDHLQRLEFELKMTKERQLDESTLSDFTLRKLIEETELKILRLHLASPFSTEKQLDAARKELTTQRKNYLRALAKLTDNTETTKILHELETLRDQQALLSRVLLRLELEAQGITITPEDVPAKKEK